MSNSGENPAPPQTGCVSAKRPHSIGCQGPRGPPCNGTLYDIAGRIARRTQLLPPDGSRCSGMSLSCGGTPTECEAILFGADARRSQRPRPVNRSLRDLRDRPGDPFPRGRDDAAGQAFDGSRRIYHCDDDDDNVARQLEEIELAEASSASGRTGFSSSGRRAGSAWSCSPGHSPDPSVPAQGHGPRHGSGRDDLRRHVLEGRHRAAGCSGAGLDGVGNSVLVHCPSPSAPLRQARSLRAVETERPSSAAFGDAGEGAGGGGGGGNRGLLRRQSKSLRAPGQTEDPSHRPTPGRPVVGDPVSGRNRAAAAAAAASAFPQNETALASGTLLRRAHSDADCRRLAATRAQLAVRPAFLPAARPPAGDVQDRDTAEPIRVGSLRARGGPVPAGREGEELASPKGRRSSCCRGEDSDCSIGLRGTGPSSSMRAVARSLSLRTDLAAAAAFELAALRPAEDGWVERLPKGGRRGSNVSCGSGGNTTGGVTSSLSAANVARMDSRVDVGRRSGAALLAAALARLGRLVLCLPKREEPVS